MHRQRTNEITSNIYRYGSYQKEGEGSRAEEKHFQLLEVSFFKGPSMMCWYHSNADTDFHWYCIHSSILPAQQIARCSICCGTQVCICAQGCTAEFWIPVLPCLLSHRFGWAPRRIISKTTLKIGERRFFRRLLVCCHRVFRNRVKNCTQWSSHLTTGELCLVLFQHPSQESDAQEVLKIVLHDGVKRLSAWSRSTKPIPLCRRREERTYSLTRTGINLLLVLDAYKLN